MKIKINALREAGISFFKPPIMNTLPSGDTTLLELSTIIGSSLKPETIALRSMEDVKRRAEFKRTKFPFVTFSGIFTNRTDRELVKHSGLICIDADHLDRYEFFRTRTFMESDLKHALFAFTSPSGDGLKVVYAIDPTAGSQKDWYLTWSGYLSKKCGLPASKLDSSCSNVSRACFLCNDPNFYINPKLLSSDPDATIEIIDIEKPLPPAVGNEKIRPVEKKAEQFSMDTLLYSKPNFEHKDWEVNFNYLVALVIKKEGEYRSPREPWIQKLASLCNQFGMQEEFTLNYVLKHFKNHPESLRPDKPIDFEAYLINPVKDVYERYREQFDTWVNMAADGEMETPLIDEAVYNNLPKVLQKACSFFTGRERDVVLLGSLGVLSTCFPYVIGMYRKMCVRANLFFFISAPASAGKGVLSFSRLIGEDFHKELADQYAEEMITYKEELQQFKDSKGESEEPVKPRLKKFFIPANSSSIKVIECLFDNSNFGLMFESEADTLFQSLKNDWGNFSDTFRRVFHHEPVELQRKGDDLYIRIKNPSMSAVLSGTPNQMDGLKNNAENGFLSRFILYDFPLDPTWADVFDDGNLNIDIEFQKISRDMHSLAKNIRSWCERAKDYYKPSYITFQLTTEQKAKFNAFFEQIHGDMHHVYGKAPLASVRRLGLIAFRMAMIFSILRMAETEQPVYEELRCQDRDLDCSFNLIKILLQHTIKIFNQLKKGGKTKSFKQNKANYYDKLPNAFNRSKAMEIAKYMEIKEKTAENYLSQFIQDAIIERPEHNSYKKM